MKQETFETDKREKFHESFWRTIIRTSLTGLVISVAFRFGQLKDTTDFQPKLSILFTTFIYIG
jgi:predicted branched-subunit amino acid permease